MNNFCTNCGNKLNENDFVCSNCGVRVRDEVQVSNNIDNGGFGWGILGFFVPIAGLILYLVWKDERPKTAKTAGKGALAYLIFYILIMVIVFAFVFVGGFNEEIIENNNSYYGDYYYDFE